MNAGLMSKRWQLLPVLAVLLLFGSLAAPASAQYYGYPSYGYGSSYGSGYGSYYGSGYGSYYGSGYGSGYGSYYGSGYSPYSSSYYGSSYSPYSSYYGSGYSPYSSSYYGSSYSPYSSYYGSGYSPYSSSYYGSSYSPYSNYYGSSYYGGYPYTSASSYCGYPYSGSNPYTNYYGYSGYNPYSSYYGGYSGYPYSGYSGSYGCPTTTTTGLVAPTGLTVTSNTPPTITLSWTAVAGATSYQVLEAISNGQYIPVTSTLSTATTASIANITAGVLYGFEVVALNAYGQQSPASSPVTVTGGTGTTTLVAPGTPALTSKPTTTSATLTWSGVANASSYRVFQSTNGSAFTLATTTTTNSVTIGTLVPGQLYSFYVQAVDAIGNVSVPSGVLSFTQ